MSLEGSFFSTPKTTPSLVLTPIAVDPNFNQVLIKRETQWGNGYLDGLDGVLNLIDSAFWGEGVHTTIVVLFTIGKGKGDAKDIS